MITFKCINVDCENNGIEFDFLDNSKVAECGFCKTILTGYNERPNPKPVVISFK